MKWGLHVLVKSRNKTPNTNSEKKNRLVNKKKNFKNYFTPRTPLNLKFKKILNFISVEKFLKFHPKFSLKGWGQGRNHARLVCLVIRMMIAANALMKCAPVFILSLYTTKTKAFLKDIYLKYLKICGTG